jgi:hypothetical protein
MLITALLPITLGLDPGSNSGAATIVSEHHVQWWCSWVKVARGIRLRVGDGTGMVIVELPRLLDVSEEIAVACRRHHAQRIVPEGLIPKDLSSMVLAESAGEVLAHIRRLGLPEQRPMAVERGGRRNQGWRRVVLGLPDQVAAQPAEEAAVRWASKLTWPATANPFARPTPLTRAELGAVSEAAAMSCYPLPSTGARP